jgi:hypothetical protein
MRKDQLAQVCIPSFKQFAALPAQLCPVENVLQPPEKLRLSQWIWSSHSYANGEGDQAQY